MKGRRPARDSGDSADNGDFRITQIINDSDIVTGIEQFHHGMTADIACATCYEYVHE
jgi:hypothetical protein